MNAECLERSGSAIRLVRIAGTALLASSLLILVPGAGLADGCFMGSYLSDVYEPAQRALIVHDPGTSREDLYIQGDYEGTTDDFAWIVPVPALPTLATAPPQLFSECAEMTKVLYQDRDSFGCTSLDTKIDAPGGNLVDVYATERVGIYDTMILGANDAGALADSLEAWGYLHERNREAVLAALRFYIDQDWFFVAMRTDASRLDDPDRAGYRYGGLEPIHLGFESAEPVYPLRVSAVSAPSWSQVLLYVCAPHRMTFEGAVAEYANRITDRELASVRRLYPGLGEAIARPCFLTKLRKNYSSNEMTADLVLERAPDDAEFRRIVYGGIPMTEMLFLAIALGAYRRLHRPRRDTGGFSRTTR